MVSRIDERGYLWLHPLAESQGRSKITAQFRGQHVRVSTLTGSLQAGVIAVPSVHFRSLAHSVPGGLRGAVLADVGASTRTEVLAAGIGLLSRVTLEKRVARLSDQWLAAPWISTRSGAAILLGLGRRLRESPVPGTVILAFVTQQHPHNAGLLRVLRSVEADRALLIAPNGGPHATVAPASGTDSDDSPSYVEAAQKIGLRLERRRSHPLQFGPFGDSKPWKAGQSLTVLQPPTRNGGTPAESTGTREIDLIISLLGRLVGLAATKGPTETASTSRGRPDASRDGEAASPTLERMVAALVDEPGISGSEERVRERIRSLLPREAADAIRIDSKGNLIVRIGSAPEPTASFIAHMDEIGYEVQRVLTDGTASASLRGGGLPEVFAWQPASVHGAQGTLPAVMTNSGLLDFGALSRERVESMGVRDGDSATVPKRYRKLLGSRVSGRSLDDRLGCAVLIEAMRRIARKARRARRSVDFVFSVEEEIGMHGARHYMQGVRPSRVYPIDTFVTAESPFGPEKLAPALLGGGAVLRAIDQSGMTPLSEVERVLAIAKRARIPVQMGVTAGGNDGSVFRFFETVNVPIGFPLRYAHSPVETADLRDAESVADLVEALALEELGLRR